MFSFVRRAKYCLPVLFVAIILSSSSEVAAAVNLKASAVSLGTSDDDLAKFIDCVEEYYFSPNSKFGERSNNFPVLYMYFGTTPPSNPHVNSTIEYDIYNMYSLEKKRNYYYIKIKGNFNFSTAYKGAYNIKYKDGDIYRCCGVYCKNIYMGVSDPTHTMIVHGHIPNTTESSTTEQSSFSFSLSGVAGYKGGADIEMRPSVSVTSSITTVTPDVKVTDDTSSDRGINWTFELKEPTLDLDFWNFADGRTSIREGAAVGRSTYCPEMNILISFPDNGKAPKLSLLYGFTLGSLGGINGVETKDLSLYSTHYFTKSGTDTDGPVIDLPFITYGKARKAAKKAGLI